MRHKVISILNQIGIKSKVQRKFFPHLMFLITALPVRFNFENLERFGSYSSRTYAKHFKNDFPFFKFNYEHIKKLKLPDAIIAVDCSFVRKSGKKSYGLGNYWDGCQSRAHKGQEISTISIIDIKNHQAYHLIANQTPPDSESKRIDFYLNQIKEHASELSVFSKYLVYDGFAYRKEFVDGICNETSLFLISKAQKNANLRYLYRGPKKKGRGRPKLYDEKIDLKNIRDDYFSKDYENERLIISSAVVNFKSFERNMKLVYIKIKKTGKYYLYFSTDLKISGLKILEYYRARFCHEFLYRDGKQFAGLMHCQSTNKKKLHYHFNASLTALSLAKSEFFANRKNKKEPFSMRNIKLHNFMKLLIERININSENTELAKIINHTFDKWMVYGKMKL